MKLTTNQLIKNNYKMSNATVRPLWATLAQDVLRQKKKIKTILRSILSLSPSFPILKSHHTLSLSLPLSPI